METIINAKDEWMIRRRLQRNAIVRVRSARCNERSGRTMKTMSHAKSKTKCKKEKSVREKGMDTLSVEHREIRFLASVRELFSSFGIVYSLDLHGSMSMSSDILCVNFPFIKSWMVYLLYLFNVSFICWTLWPHTVTAKYCIKHHPMVNWMTIIYFILTTFKCIIFVLTIFYSTFATCDTL